MKKPRLAVFYDEGSASPVEIASALGHTFALVFVTAPSEHCARLHRVLDHLAEMVVEWRGAGATAHSLRQIGSYCGVLCFSEAMLMAAASTAERLGLAFNSVATTERLLRKDSQRRALSGSTSTAVRHRRLTTANLLARDLEYVGTPAVLKPIRGRGSRDTHRVHSAGEVLHLVGSSDGAALRRYQVEELLVGAMAGDLGDYVSVESLSVAGVRYHLAVTQKLPLVPPFRETAHVWGPADALDSTSILSVTTTALDLLEVENGLTHTELKLTADGPRIIEVNGRLGGFINGLAAVALGIDFITLAAAATLAEVPHAGPYSFDQYHYAFTNLAPIPAHRLLATRGHEVARRAPGVQRARPLIRAPMSLEPGVGTRELDLIIGGAPTIAVMREQLGAALQVVEFEFELTDGDHLLFRATELPSFAALQPESPRPVGVEGGLDSV